jgi:hypothetical protein
MRTVVERLRSMDRYCFVDGQMDGSLVFRVDNDRCVPHEPLTTHTRAGLSVTPV